MSCHFIDMAWINPTLKCLEILDTKVLNTPYELDKDKYIRPQSKKGHLLPQTEIICECRKSL